MIRALRLAAVLASVSLPSLAIAQTTDPIGQAVANTIYENQMRRGATAQQALNTFNQTGTAFTAVVQTMNNPVSWFPMLAQLAFPEGGRIDNCGGFCNGGDTGGAGADQGYDCPEFTYSILGGYLVVPSIPLTGGQPMKVGDPLYSWFANQHNLGYTYYNAHAPRAAGQYGIHLANIAIRGTDPRAWWGVWSTSQSGNSTLFNLSSVAYYSGTTLQPVHAYSTWVHPDGGTYNGNYTGNLNCPNGDTDPTKHYYMPKASGSGPYTACTAYSPNLGLSPSGYAYSPKASILYSQVPAYVSSYNKLATCAINPEVIRAMASELLRRASTQAGYSGLPYEPVPASDVRYGPDQPDIADTNRAPQLPTPNAGTQPPPAPTPTPTPTATATSGTDYTDPGIEDSGATLTVPDLPTTEWFPAMNLSLGNPACPTYSFDAFETHYTVDSHCAFIEQFRAVISAFMIILFTVGAARIIMGA